MFTLESQGFENKGIMPIKYAEGDCVSPPLNWYNIPDGTKSFAIAMTDPDVSARFNFPRAVSHWVMYDIPALTTSIPEGASPGINLPTGAKELNSDFVAFDIPGFTKGYGPPWPPDASHRYVFFIFALRVETLDISENADFVEFSGVILPQTIDCAVLTGKYGPAKTPIRGLDMNLYPDKVK